MLAALINDHVISKLKQIKLSVTERQETKIIETSYRILTWRHYLGPTQRERIPYSLINLSYQIIFVVHCIALQLG